MKEYADNIAARSARRRYLRQQREEQTARVTTMVSMILDLGEVDAAVEYVNARYRVRDTAPFNPKQKPGRKKK